MYHFHIYKLSFSVFKFLYNIKHFFLKNVHYSLIINLNIQYQNKMKVFFDKEFDINVRPLLDVVDLLKENFIDKELPTIVIFGKILFKYIYRYI